VNSAVGIGTSAKIVIEKYIKPYFEKHRDHNFFMVLVFLSKFYKIYKFNFITIFEETLDKIANDENIEPKLPSLDFPFIDRNPPSNLLDMTMQNIVMMFRNSSGLNHIYCGYNKIYELNNTTHQIIGHT